MFKKLGAALEQWFFGSMLGMTYSRGYAASAINEALECIDRVEEWKNKYPHTSFRHSPEGRRLLSELSRAEHACFIQTGDMRMREAVQHLISLCLAQGSGYDPPPHEPLLSPARGA